MEILLCVLNYMQLTRKCITGVAKDNIIKLHQLLNQILKLQTNRGNGHNSKFH